MVENKTNVPIVIDLRDGNEDFKREREKGGNNLNVIVFQPIRLKIKHFLQRP